MPESLISEISYFSYVKRCTREGRTLERSVIVVVFFEFLNSGYSNCRLGGRSVILDPLLELHYGSQQILLLRGRSRGCHCEWYFCCVRGSAVSRSD